MGNFAQKSNTICCHDCKKILNVCLVSLPVEQATSPLLTLKKATLDVPSTQYLDMFSKLNSMRFSDELTDVKIHCGSTVFSCHSVVLFCRSYYFEKLLSEAGVSSDDKSALYHIWVSKDKMKQDVLEGLLNFIYLGEISIPKDRLDEYLDAAKLWDLQYIRSCEKVTLGQYIQRSSTSAIFDEVFTAAELLSPSIDVKDKNFEENVKKKLSLYCPLPVEGKKASTVFPPFNIVISAENVPGVYCHRELLSSFSEYFYAMLATSRFSESRHDKVTLKDIELSTLVPVLQFIYNSKIRFKEENAHNIAMVAGWLCPGSKLLTKVQKYLVKSLSYENCVVNLHFADLQSFGHLRNESANLANNNLTAVAKSSSFNELSYDELCYYLSNNDLLALNETEVFYAFEQWAGEKKDKDMIYNAFLKVVRLSLFTYSQLRGLISTSSPLYPKRNKKFWDLPCFDEILRDLTLAQQLTYNMPIELRMLQYNQSFRNCMKQFALFSESFVEERFKKLRITDDGFFHVFHVDFPSQSIDSVSRRVTHNLKTCCSFQQNGRRLGSYAAAVYDNSLYITGGGYYTQFSSIEVTNKTLIYQPSDGQCWKVGPSLLTARYGHCMAVVNGCLYVLGGFDSSGNFAKTVEQFLYCKNKWKVETTLLSSGPNIECVGWKKKIYVFTMSRVNTCVYACMHCYCTKMRNWFQSTNLGFNTVTKPLCFSNAIVYDEKIYVFAEDLSSKSFTIVSVFEPVTETWFPNQLEIEGTGSPFLRDNQIYFASSYDYLNLRRPSIVSVLFNPLKIVSLKFPELFSVDKSKLISNLPSLDDSGKFQWLEAYKNMRLHCRLFRPVFVNLHSYYPTNEPRKRIHE